MIIDKDMNTLELDLPSYMLSQINYDNTQVKQHKTKAQLQAEISEFIKKSQS